MQEHEKKIAAREERPPDYKTLIEVKLLALESRLEYEKKARHSLSRVVYLIVFKDLLFALVQFFQTH